MKFLPCSVQCLQLCAIWTIELCMCGNHTWWHNSSMAANPGCVRCRLSTTDSANASLCLRKLFAVLGLFCLCRSYSECVRLLCFCCFFVKKMNFGNLLTGGFEESSSLASLTVSFGDEVDVVASVFRFSVVGGYLCHRGSDRFSSLSDDTCQFEDFSSFLPCGVRDLTSSGINHPLKLFNSCFRLIFCVVFM